MSLQRRCWDFHLPSKPCRCYYPLPCVHSSGSLQEVRTTDLKWKSACRCLRMKISLHCCHCLLSSSSRGEWMCLQALHPYCVQNTLSVHLRSWYHLKKAGRSV